MAETAPSAPAVTPDPAAAPVVTPAAVPEWVDPKFRTAENPIEAQAKAYTEAQKLIGQRSAAKPAEPATTTPAVATPPQDDKPAVPAENAAMAATLTDNAGVSDLLKQIGVAPEDISEQWTKDQKLNDETYAKFKTKGITRGVVDEVIKMQYEASQVLRAEQGDLLTQAVRHAGGEDQLNNLFAFARSEYSPAEQERLNNMLAKPGTFKAAIDEISSKKNSKLGVTARVPMITGSQSGPSGAAGFSSKEEMFSAMKEGDKRLGSWQKDPAIMARLQKTPPALTRGF